MNTVIEAQNLRKEYGEFVAVEDVTFSVEEGEIFGILGPNGAGKTTTVECLQGLRRADGGQLSVLGFDPRTEEMFSVQEVESGGGSIRHMFFDAETNSIWFGADANTVGQAKLPPRRRAVSY